jgi:hypothetical protein
MDVEAGTVVAVVGAVDEGGTFADVWRRLGGGGGGNPQEMMAEVFDLFCEKAEKEGRVVDEVALGRWRGLGDGEGKQEVTNPRVVGALAVGIGESMQPTEVVHYRFGEDLVTVMVERSARQFVWRLIVNGRVSPVEWRNEGLLVWEGYAVASEYWEPELRPWRPFKVQYVEGFGE